MGTNYYAWKNVCKCCGKPEEEFHIGKISSGWRYVLKINPEEYSDYETFTEWIMDDNIKIFDEYNKEIDKYWLLDEIVSRKDLQKRPTDNYFTNGKICDYSSADFG